MVTVDLLCGGRCKYITLRYYRNDYVRNRTEEQVAERDRDRRGTEPNLEENGEGEVS